MGAREDLDAFLGNEEHRAYLQRLRRRCNKSFKTDYTPTPRERETLAEWARLEGAIVDERSNAFDAARRERAAKDWDEARRWREGDATAYAWLTGDNRFDSDQEAREHRAQQAEDEARCLGLL